MSSPSAPTPPSYQNLNFASGNNLGAFNSNAQTSLDLQQGAIKWATDQYGTNQAATQAEQGQLLKTQAKDITAGDAMLSRYNRIYNPLEDKYVQQVQNYASPERMTLERGKAIAGAGQAADAAIANANRNLESYGVDPSAARFGALNTGAQLARAASQAGAGTASDKAITDTGLQLESGALQAAAGQPGQAISTLNAGNAPGASAVQLGNQTTATAAGALGNPLGYGGLATQNLMGANSALNTQGGFNAQDFQNQNAQFQANANSSSGVGSALGLGLGVAGGVAGAYFGGPAGASLGFNAGRTAGSLFNKRGGLIPRAVPAGAGASSAMPMHGAVPTSMSPSGGAQTDDVVVNGPGGSQPRINAGEFILPVRTVQHYGTKFLQNLIAKGDKASGIAPQPPAAPEMKAVETAATGGTPFNIGKLREIGVTTPVPVSRLEPRNPTVPHVNLPLPTMAVPAMHRGAGHMRVTPSPRPMRMAA